MSELYEDLLWFRQMDNEMEDFLKREVANDEQRDMRVVREKGTEIQQSRESLQVLHTGMRQEGNRDATSESSGQAPSHETVVGKDKDLVSGLEGTLRILPAPEPHEPTKVLGWLLVGFAGFCVYVLGATIFKFWPVIVRTLR